MRMLDEITLVTVTPSPGTAGKTEYARTAKAVYCQRKSAKRAEWYAANAAGIQVDDAFDVLTDEYDGQTEAVYAGKRYRIFRTYEDPKTRLTELNCTRIQ